MNFHIGLSESGLVVITLELIGDALQGAAAIDALAKPETAIVRGLLEGSFPFYGAVGLIMSAFFLASAGYVTVAAGVLPNGTVGLQSWLRLQIYWLLLRSFGHLIIRVSTRQPDMQQ